MDYVELHCHDNYSTLDGIGKTKALIERAKELGYKALAQTNHGNVDGAVKFYKECKKVGIKPIVGAELYVVNEPTNFKEQRRHHLLALAKNFKGFQEIMKALTRGNQEQHYYRPLVTWDQALEMENVLFSTACAQGMLAHPSYLEIAKTFKEKFDGSFFTEVMPLPIKEQQLVNQRAVECWQKFKIPIIATGDLHYVLKEDWKAQEVALAIGTKKKWNDKDRYRFTVKGLYLKTPQEVRESFLPYFPDKVVRWMMANTLRAAALCNFEIPKIEVDLPIPARYAEKVKKAGVNKTLVREAYAGLQRLGLEQDEYKERLRYELNEVITLGFALYFLVIADVIEWCKENGIMVGPGRGSVGGSLLAYSLSMTQVNPLRYGLSFERFISPGRIDLPDIDVDFQDDRRDEVINYIKIEYGEKSVAQVRTFGEMHGRQALRDVARVFDVPISAVDRAAKSIIKRSGGDAREDYSIKDAFGLFEECKAFKRHYPHVVNIASRLEGIIRQPGIHAAGVVIANGNLYDGRRCVVVNGKDGAKVVNWDKRDIDDFGLMKLDCLGLSTLSVLRRAKELVKKNHDEDIEYESIPLDDKEILDQFSKGNTVGIFQFGSPGLSAYCRQVGIEDFERLVAVNALWRPGTLKSGMVTEYSEIKNGHKQVVNVSEFYDRITKDTYGIMLYQEQIMQVLFQGAGIGWRTVDTIRKVISKSEGTEKLAGFKKEFGSLVVCLMMKLREFLRKWCSLDHMDLIRATLSPIACWRIGLCT
jgi:DNA polymerase-3 subunit alpha